MKPLSERLLEAAEWEIHMPTELREWLEEGAALAKSVESGPEATVMRLNGVLMLSDIDSDCFSLIGQRVALVPLPQ